MRRELSAAVGPVGCPGGDLGEQLAGSLVVDGVQPRQRPAQLLRFVVTLQTPGAEGQAVQAAEEWAIVDPPQPSTPPNPSGSEASAIGTPVA
jgi:hypothetical protein